MKGFIDWLVTYEHVFTLATVLLSGLISWWISAIYFKRGNRNALRLSVLSPMKLIIQEQPSWKNYKLLEDISKGYNSKYLTKKEGKVLYDFLEAYKKVCPYKESSVYADSLIEYFCYKLEKNGINTNCEPVEIDGEIVAYSTPTDLCDLHDKLCEIFEGYADNFMEEDDATEAVENWFEVYCKQCYTDMKIEYFDDYSLEKVIKKSEITNKWEKELSKYKEEKEKFLGMKVFEDN